MGADQHYVPVFISKSFAGEHALHYVPASPATARDFYRWALLHGSTRQRPVLVFDKSKGVLVTKPTERVCVARHLYSIPRFEEVEATGIAVSIIEKFIGLTLPRPANDGELMKWAREVGGSGTAREVLEGKLNDRIERPAYTAIEEIIRDGRIRQQHVRSLALFLEFSMVRVPNWYAYNREGLEGFALRTLSQFEPICVRSEHFEAGVKFLGLYEQVAKRISYLMLLCTFLSDDRRNNSLLSRGRFKAVLFRAGSVPFIQCDNPARPMYLSAAQRAHKQPAPGLREPGSFLVYPISPKFMLGFTTDSNVMHLATIRLDKRNVQRVNAGLLHLAVREVILPSDKRKSYSLTAFGFRPPSRSWRWEIPCIAGC